MTTYILFILLMIIVFISICFSLRVKHKNIGFVITSSVLIVADVLSMLLISAETIKEARNLLLVYYIFYPWLFFGTLLTVIRSHTQRLHLDCNIGMAVICSIQSVIIAACFFKNGLINFSQVAVFGRVWWVVRMPLLEFVPDVFIAYHALCLINCIIIFSMMLVFAFNVPRVFKFKYYNLMFLQGIMFVLILVTFINNLPVWIHTLVMNFVCFFTYYYIFIYSDQKLRDTVLYDFANELSDGVVIYNMYNDVIHINNRFKNIVSEDIINGIHNIELMERFVSRTEMIGDFTVIPYTNEDRQYYFRIDKKKVGPDGDIIGTVYMFHDMSSEIAQMKLMKEINNDLEKDSLIRSDYLTFVTNRLLVPINHILKLTDVALVENNISPDERDRISLINRSGISLKNIVNEMHDHSMLDKDSFTIRPEGYEPLSEIYDVCKNIQGSLSNDDTDFMFIIDPELPFKLIGDKFRIRQIVVSLCDLMIRLISHGVVRIVLSCRPISENDICIDFHLIGMGIDIKEFDPEKNRDSRFEISQKLIEYMNGNLDISRSSQNEIEFRFSLPQKVLDDRKKLVVENSSRKYAFCLNEKNILNDEFKKEMKALGMDGKVITQLNDYKATGKTDYLFFIREYFNAETEKFLSDHPMVNGIMLIDNETEIVTSIPNLRYIIKPLSTLSMVLALNGMEFKNL